VTRFACLLAAAVLVVAPEAVAKGPDIVRVCGASGCSEIHDVAEVNALALYTSGFESRSEPAAAPFFTVHLTSSVHDLGNAGWSFLYVPSARALKIIRADFSGGVYDEPTTNSWVSLSDEALAAYQRATPVMSPFPANADWVVSTTDDRESRWLIVMLVVAAGAVALLLLSRRLATRRAARLAHN
jgi:hypothetical protein